MGHVPKEGEDHKAREETGQRVDGAGYDGISGKKYNGKARVHNKNVKKTQRCKFNMTDTVMIMSELGQGLFPGD